MDPIIFTPRLKLTLITTADRRSPEFEWLHELRSDEQATWWSILGQAKTFQDTEKALKSILPTDAEKAKKYRIVYAVHTLHSPPSSKAPHKTPPPPEEKSSEFIGLVTLMAVDEDNLTLPESLTLTTEARKTVLATELGYLFLPRGWGQGYATESVTAVLDACRRTRSFWEPWEKVHVRAIVNQENPASQRVMDKTGMEKRGVYHWRGGPLWLAGEWTTGSFIWVYGLQLLE